MIEKLTFITDFRCFKKGREIEFRPGVNLLVGEQGTGKSTIVKLIRDYGGRDKYDIEKAVKTIDLQYTGYMKMYAFDFEKDNFRTKSYFDDSVGFHVASMFNSHGQMVNQLLTAIKDAKDSLVIIDEPDMALSIRSCYQLVDILNTCANENNCQIIAAVHHPIIISAFDEVYSCEHKKWMKSKNFIKSHTPKKPKA